MAEKLHRDDRVGKTWSRTLLGNNEGRVTIPKLMDVYETIMSAILSENNCFVTNAVSRCQLISRRYCLSGTINASTKIV